MWELAVVSHTADATVIIGTGGRRSDRGRQQRRRPPLRRRQVAKDQVVEAIGALDRQRVARIAELHESRSGHAGRDGAAERRWRNRIVRGADDQRRNAIQHAQLRQRGVARHRAQLPHQDRRLIGEIAAEQRLQVGREPVAIDAAQVVLGHDHVEHRPAAHDARSDAASNAEDRHFPGELRRCCAVGERAREDQAPDSGRVHQRKA